ncbi:long-chain fatty acid--CoA ligase, partial [Enterococcus faecalis]|nr:long-chain fatty acid--CoA ligase [Enterococcus faecalis]
QKESNAVAILLATSLLNIDNSIIPYDAHQYTKIEDVEFTNDVIVISEEDFDKNTTILTDVSNHFINSPIEKINIKDIVEKESLKDIQLFFEKSCSPAKLILYTSGTTGKSKGVIVSYNQFNFINVPITEQNEGINIITKGSSVRPFLGTILSTLKEGKTILQIDVDNCFDMTNLCERA